MFRWQYGQCCRFGLFNCLLDVLQSITGKYTLSLSDHVSYTQCYLLSVNTKLYRHPHPGCFTSGFRTGRHWPHPLTVCYESRQNCQSVMLTSSLLMLFLLKNYFNCFQFIVEM